MSKNLSRRGILLAAGGATATVVAATSMPKIVRAQEGGEDEIRLDDLEGEDFDADLAYSFYVYVYNRSNVVKHNIRIGVDWKDFGSQLIPLGSLPAYRPPDPIPFISYSRSGRAAVRFHFGWREGLNMRRFPRPPKKAADGKYFSYIAFGWDERNQPQLYTYEATL